MTELTATETRATVRPLLDASRRVEERPDSILDAASENSGAWEGPLRRIAIPLALVAIASFLPVLRNGFVDWDDHRNFLANPHFRGLGWSQLRWAWSTFHLGVYQPFAWILLAGEYASWSLDPRGYHVASLLLHAANTVVLYVLAGVMIGRCLPATARTNSWDIHLGAGLAALLFAVHPLRTEAVAWVSSQPYLPCALFAMVSVILYLRANEEGAPRRTRDLVGAWCLFVAALLFKAAALAIPVVLVILDFYPLRRLDARPGRWFSPAARRVWFEKLPFGFVSAAFMVLAFRAKQANQSVVSIENDGLSARLAQACYGLWFYPAKTLVPTGLSAYYALPRQIDWTVRPFWVCLVLSVGAAAALLLVRKRWPGIVAATAAYLVILAPNVGLVRIGDQAAADRYSYLASIPVAVLLAYGLTTLCRSSQRRRAAIAVAGTTLAIALIPLDWRQSRTWRTTDEMWANALSAYADNHDAELVLINSGNSLARRGKVVEAIARYHEVLGLYPESARAHIGLGSAFARQRKYDESADHYEQALRIEPQSVRARANLGALRIEEKKLREGMQHCRDALRIDPEFADAHANLGVALAFQGKLDEASSAFRETLRIEPKHSSAHQNLGRILAHQGRLEEAAAEVEEALRIEPNSRQSEELLFQILGDYVKRMQAPKTAPRTRG